MNIIQLSEIISNEKEVKVFLKSKGLLQDFKTCIYCSSERIDAIRRNKIKCYSCNKEWSEKQGSIFNIFRIPYKKLIMALKLFEIEISALEASKQLEVSYNTVLKLYTLIRNALMLISDNKALLSGEIELDESYFGGKRKGKRGRGSQNKTPVFGILERNGKVKVEVVPDVKSDTLKNLTIQKVKRGSLIYTDTYRSYNGLVSYGFKHERINKSYSFANGKVYINGIEGFWSYAKERLMKFHGVSKTRFPLYLKELEFRYNNRQKNMYELILEAIVKYNENRLGGNY